MDAVENDVIVRSSESYAGGLPPLTTFSPLVTERYSVVSAPSRFFIGRGDGNRKVLGL